MLKESRMSFRVSALVAVALALGSVTPAFAQPQVPPRPRSSPFGNVFTPGPAALAPPGQGAFGFNGPVAGPVVAGFGGPLVPGFGFAYPNQSLAFPQVLPGAFAVNPAPTSSGGATFNNLGHWYGGSYGSYGHWYPNGVANGRGVLGYGGGLYGGGGLVGGAGTTGGAVRPGGLIGNVGGTALMGGAAAGQFRR
jgi:hypothetical protein